MRTDLCSACHPFFTGEMRIVDTAGQVERFVKRLEKRSEMLEETPTPAPKAKASRGKKIQYELVEEDAAAEAAGEDAEKAESLKRPPPCECSWV